jgi:hypothetical protein
MQWFRLTKSAVVATIGLGIAVTPADAGFWTTYNMPVTRTMSPAKVQLLRTFLAQQTKTPPGT